MESSVVIIILTCCINKQRMAKWVNIKKEGRAFKPDILIQVMWLLVTSKVERSFLELIGARSQSCCCSSLSSCAEAFVKALAAEM